MHAHCTHNNGEKVTTKKIGSRMETQARNCRFTNIRNNFNNENSLCTNYTYFVVAFCDKRNRLHNIFLVDQNEGRKIYNGFAYLFTSCCTERHFLVIFCIHLFIHSFLACRLSVCDNNTIANCKRNQAYSRAMDFCYTS